MKKAFQLKAAKGSVLPAVIAAVSSISCLLAFGADAFILPSLMGTVFLLLVLRPRPGKEAAHSAACC